jgi:hypothetical protein
MNINQQNFCFQNTLTGENAFYLHPDYIENTQKEFAQIQAVQQITYEYETENKCFSIVKDVASVIIFPIAIHSLFHSLAAKVALLPASKLKKEQVAVQRSAIANFNLSISGLDILNTEEEPIKWKYKRLTVKTNRYKIDGIIIGTADTLGNGKWVLACNGNSECYENQLGESQRVKTLINEIRGNALVFNYPGVGASSGLPKRKAMVKAYRSMLRFLEDENGIGAKKIIGYGYSIGGATQIYALKKHILKPHIKYVFIEDKVFSKLSKLASEKVKGSGFIVKTLGWNMNPAKVARKMEIPEIILQNVQFFDYHEITDSSMIEGDEVLSVRSSLATALLEDKKCSRTNKVFIGVPETHSYCLRNPEFIAEKIKEQFSKYPKVDAESTSNTQQTEQKILFLQRHI